MKIMRARAGYTAVEVVIVVASIGVTVLTITAIVMVLMALGKYLAS